MKKPKLKGENLKIVIDKIINGEFDHLSGVDISRAIGKARKLDVPENAPPSPKVAVTIEKSKEILALANSVHQFTVSHFRVDGFLDLWPSSYRYHNLRTKERGFYTPGRLQEFVDFTLYKKTAL